jgi:hypothetical protein
MNWIVKYLVNWLVANLTEELIRDWADQLKVMIMPWVHSYKAKIIAELRAAAADSTTPLDDVAVDALEKFLNALLPAAP